jgi:hypothetical protein
MAQVQTLIQAWQSSNTQAPESPLLSPDLKEPPNALAVGICLQPLALKDLCDWMKTATEEEIKAHKGLRINFMIAQLLYAGFTWVGDSSKGKGPVERLGVFDGEDKRTVIFYTFKGEQNKKEGKYLKTKRFDECAAVSQGEHLVLMLSLSYGMMMFHG